MIVAALAGPNLGVLVGIDSLAWIAISVVAGLVCTQLSTRFLMTDTFITRPRQWEQDGRIYRRFGIQKWKTALPETNAMGPGERVSKRTLPSWSELGSLTAETRRAEYVHWLIALAGPLFLAWNPPSLGLFMVFFGFAFNTPFVMIQRYNRFRLTRVASRMEEAR